MLSLRPCEKMNGSIACDHLKNYHVDWVLGFNFVGREQANYCSEFTIWTWQKLCSSVKNYSMFGGRGCLSLLKSLAAWSFLLSLIARDKNWPFLILNEIYLISSCTTSLIRNSGTPRSLFMDLIDLLGSLLVMASILPTNSRVLILSE